MIISVSSDNTVKQWIWNTDNVYIYINIQDFINPLKYHTIHDDETIEDIVKKYDIKIEDICEWNKIKDARLLYKVFNYRKCGDIIIVGLRKKNNNNKCLEISKYDNTNRGSVVSIAHPRNTIIFSVSSINELPPLKK